MAFGHGIVTGSHKYFIGICSHKDFIGAAYAAIKTYGHRIGIRVF